ncbi:unnamed protein product [Bursaphelenchus xylophilus]|uniref:(pine wood nematode) hypothetical protein n=1 Tax=Bursaphelenchus xylophilus TaxID=6326 RepID=A0A1I7SLH0_BURXY|nr:unnamed protein product [Bursaphelenchus xylophilus]CAG9129589.1 unnamed protein product [Bursaphelenchus xylophilus]
MPKLSNKQYMGLLTVHEENLLDLGKCKDQPGWFQKQVYDAMCKAIQQKLNLKLTPISLRSHMGKLRQRVERKVNNAAIKTGSTEEDVLSRSAGFTPVEAKLYRLLTDKEKPLTLLDNHDDIFKADGKEPAKPVGSTPRKRPRKEKTDKEITENAGESHSESPKQERLQPSEPEGNNVDVYMDTIERVAQMGRLAPTSEVLEVQIPPPAKKIKKSDSAEAPSRSPKSKNNKKKKNPQSEPLPAFELFTHPDDEPTEVSLSKQKQQLIQTQKLLAEKRLLLESRQAEVLQSQARFYDAWAGLAQTVSSFFRLLPIPPPMPQAV